MKVVPATVSDIPVIKSIAQQTWPDAYSGIISHEQIEYMLQLFYSAPALKKQMEDGHHFILAVDDGSTIGFAAWQLKTPVLARLHKLYVLPDLQQKNVGKKLLESVIQQAQKAGASKLELNVNRNNPALSFYKKHGFKIDQVENIDIGNGYFMNDYVMSREV